MPCSTAFRSSSSPPEALALALVIADAALAAEEAAVLVAGRGDADLVAVGIDGDPDRVLGQDHHPPPPSLPSVGDPVGTLRTGGKADHVPRLEVVLAAGVAERRRPLEHDQPLLLGVLVVVGADALPGRQVVDRAA